MILGLHSSYLYPPSVTIGGFETLLHSPCIILQASPIVLYSVTHSKDIFQRRVTTVKISCIFIRVHKSAFPLFVFELQRAIVQLTLCPHYSSSDVAAMAPFSARNCAGAGLYGPWGGQRPTGPF